MATVKEQRKKYVKTAKKFIGAKQGSKLHKKIVDTFNTLKPNGEVMNYSAPWCAASVTAWSIMAFGVKDAKKAFPLSYNCGRLIDQAKKMGAWVEKDSYTPKAGDLIIFNWDGQIGEVKSGADHVGVVEKVADGYITSIEGNYSAVSQVGRRTLPIGWVYIRGFVVPLYDKISTPTNESSKPKTSLKTQNKAFQGVLYHVKSDTGLNVRKGPSVAYKIVTAIPNKTAVRITKQKDGWGYAPSLGGWMFMAYLKK